MKKIADDIAAMSFETALKELETLSEKMSKGGLSLEESVEAYSRGAQLKKHCTSLLKAAEEKIRMIDASLEEPASNEDDAFDPLQLDEEDEREDDNVATSDASKRRSAKRKTAIKDFDDDLPF